MTSLLQQTPRSDTPCTEAFAARDDIPTAFAILRARWQWMCAGLAFAIVAGCVARSQYSDRIEFSGTILHTPLPAGESSKHIVPVADLKSLSALVKSPESLQKVVQHEQLEISPQALADRLEVKTVPGSQTLGVNLQWRGQGNGEAVLDSVMKEFITRASESRRRRINERAADFHASRAESERELQTGRVELAAFHRKYNIVDLPHELRTATLELDTLAATLSLSRRNEANGKAQLESLDGTIDRLTQQATSPGGTPQTPARLQQMIAEERLREQAQAKLEIKRREFERIQKVVAKGAASNVELDRVNAEIAGLQSNANDNEKIQEWKKELGEIEKNANLPPLLQQAFAKKLELDLQMLGYRNEIPLLEADTEAKQQRVEELLKLQTEVAPLLWQVERAEAERNRMQAHLDQIRVILAMTGGEATIYQSAAAVAKPFGGVKGWLMPAAVGGCAFLMWIWALVACSSHSEKSKCESLPKEMGLSVLAHLPAGLRAPEAGTKVRSLALSLRQRLPRAGSTILFTPIDGGSDTHELLRQTAECFAQRDERVLIIDAVCNEAGERVSFGAGAKAVVLQDHNSFVSQPQSHAAGCGLSNYLAFEFAWPNEVVQPTETYGVDFLPAGNAVISPDALATHRMRELLELMRQTYSIILIAGPPATAAIDVQILAAYQDGAVIVLDESGHVSPSTRDLFHDYRRIGVPFLGCIQLAG